jgi:hypothetical protein
MNDEITSLQRQLANAEENLRLIQERKSEYVSEEEIPLQLIKNERKLVERIAELRQRLGLPPASGAPQGSAPPASGSASSETNSGQQAGINYGTMNQYNTTHNYYGPPPDPPASTPPTPAAPNPFGRRGRIDNAAEFFGREELLRRIFEELGKRSNLSLIGEREIGKSSLLYMIEHLAHERLNPPLDGFIGIDMQIIHSEEDFFAALCDELQIAPACRGYPLKRQLRNKRYILCLDEIEKMKREKFTVDVRAELRGLADGANAPLTLVVASHLPLNELFADSHDGTSPLYNICHSLNVLPFTRPEARAFLAARLQGTGVQFSEDEIADLLEQSQRHPARLQQVAADLYRAKTGQGA